MKNSIYILSLLLINLICYSQSKDLKLIEKTELKKEVDRNDINYLEKVMLQESIKNRGCRFDINIDPEDCKKNIGKRDPYSNMDNIKRDY